MRSPLKYLVVVLAVLVTVSTATAQTFTGGLRGAVKDANGVIPGVTVELVNESTNVAREVVSNEQGLYNFAAVAPGVYTIKASLTGFKSYEQKGVRISAQQFVTIDVSMEVGALQETITVTGEAPLIDTSTASTGAVINTEQLNIAAERRPFGVPVRRHGAHGRGLGRRAVQPPAGSDQRLAAVAGRRHAPRQQLPDRRRAGHRPSQPRVGQPLDRRPRRRQRAGAHLRRGDGSHRWRHLQHRDQVGRQPLLAAAASTRRVRAGAWPTTSSPSWRASRCRRPTSTSVAAASVVRSSRTARSSGSRPRGYGSNTTRNGARALPDHPRARRRLLADATPAATSWSSTTRSTGNADGTGRTPFPGNIIPANRLNQVGRNIANTYPKPTRDVSNGSNNFESTAEIEDRAMHVHRQGRSQVHRQGVAERLLPVQQDRRALRQLLGARPERPARATPTRATTCCGAASTCWRSTTPGCPRTTRC